MSRTSSSGRTAAAATTRAAHTSASRCHPQVRRDRPDCPEADTADHRQVAAHRATVAFRDRWRQTIFLGGLPGAGWRAVAADDLAVGALDLAGAVGVGGQGPAQFVQHHVMVPPAVILEVGEAGVAAVGPVGDVVGLAAARGLVAAAQLVVIHKGTYFPNPHRRGSRDQDAAPHACPFTG